MSKDQLIVGLDIGKEEVVAATTEQRRTRTFAATPGGRAQLTQWLTERGAGRPVHVGLESTGVYSLPVALALAGQPQVTVSICSPGQIHTHGQTLRKRTKTDHVDARVIADYVLRYDPPAWIPPPLSRRQLQVLVSQRDGLVAERVRWQNRQHAQGYTPDMPEVVVISTAVMLATLTQQITQIDAALTALVASDPDLARDVALADSIKGIGLTAAVQLIAYGGVALTSYNRKELAAYAGLAPGERRSGSSVRGKSHLNKQGNAALRRALYMPTLSAVRSNPAVQDHYQRLLARSKPKKVAHAAAMHKLLLLLRAILITRIPFNPNHRKQTMQENTLDN